MPAKLYTVQIKRDAERSMRRLPADLRERIEDAFDKLAANPRRPGVVALQGFASVYRFRVGDWRIIYLVEDDVLLVLVLEVAPRGDVYRRL